MQSRIYYWRKERQVNALSPAQQPRWDAVPMRSVAAVFVADNRINAIAIKMEIHASMINNVAAKVVGSAMEHANATKLVKDAVPVRTVATVSVAMQTDAIARDLMTNACTLRSVAATGNARIIRGENSAFLGSGSKKYLTCVEAGRM